MTNTMICITEFANRVYVDRTASALGLVCMMLIGIMLGLMIAWTWEKEDE